MLASSSVYPKLYTNERLTDDEETEVRRVKREPLNKLKAVECEIARLQGRLIVLRQRKEDAEHTVEVYQDLLSPIRRLLPEILQEIFWRCLPTTHNSVLSFEEAPLLLGRICRQWRQIAYSTPKLWASLHIVAVPLTWPRAKERFDAFNAWLSRSRALPLSISMSTFKRTNMFMDQLWPYLRLIATHARRWRNIHLQAEPLDRMDILTEISADNLPLLELFCIQGCPFEILDRSLSKKDSILHAPILHALSIHEYSLRLLGLPVQCRNITSLDLGAQGLALPGTLKLLTLCFNLETCVLNIGALDGPLSSISPSLGSRHEIVLPKLRTLTVYGESIRNDDSLTLFNCLSTPALRHLAYQRHFWMPTLNLLSTDFLSSLKNFRSFFQSLNKPLEELDLDARSFTTGYLMEFLHLLPGLRRLSLKHFFDPPGPAAWSFGDRLLLGFIPYEHRSLCLSCSLIGNREEAHDPNFPSFACLCPNLEVLKVVGAFVSKPLLLEYLRTRLVDYGKYNIARLRRFSISFDPRPEDDNVTTEEITALSEESGLLVKLAHLPAATFEPAPQSLEEICPAYRGIQKIFGVSLV